MFQADPKLATRHQLDAADWSDKLNQDLDQYIEDYQRLKHIIGDEPSTPVDNREEKNGSSLSIKITSKLPQLNGTQNK